MKGYDLPTRSLVKNDQAMMVERPDVPRARFMGSWTRNTTFNAGLIVPFLVDEVLPGDMMKYDVTAYLRMSTPLFPMFDSQRVDTFFFFVPNRLVWPNWVKFMGEQDAPTDSIDYTVPQIIKAGGFITSSVGDHFGLPIQFQINDLTASVYANALPFRAYQLIFNQWFRDQNLVPPVDSLEYDDLDAVFGSGVDIFPEYRAKLHDYFTSALPWPSKFPNAEIPINGKVPVTGIYAQTPGNLGPYSERDSTGQIVNFPYAASNQWLEMSGTTAADFPQVFVDLASSAGIGLNALRNAWMVQSLVERDARGGTRYIELLKNHFGVTSPDARLQRPELIGGGSTPLNITPIAQTVSSAEVPLGALGGAGTAAGQHRASFSATEHGFIIGLINVQSELSYQQGIPRMFSRQTRYDYYWPSTAHLGEQAILRKEIFAKGIVGAGPYLDDTVFGYQERWHEYRSRYSEVTGLFRRGAVGGSLEEWHLSQFFTGAPLLNRPFIEDRPPMSRVLAAGDLADNQQYLANIMIRRDATRPMPAYSTPALIGGRF